MCACMHACMRCRTDHPYIVVRERFGMLPRYIVHYYTEYIPLALPYPSRTHLGNRDGIMFGGGGKAKREAKNTESCLDPYHLVKELDSTINKKTKTKKGEEKEEQ